MEKGLSRGEKLEGRAFKDALVLMLLCPPPPHEWAASLALN